MDKEKSMIDVVFSTLNNGACPLCKRREDCHILQSIEKILCNDVKPKYDHLMEIVIYRCPEFE